MSERDASARTDVYRPLFVHRRLALLTAVDTDCQLSRLWPVGPSSVSTLGAGPAPCACSTSHRTTLSRLVPRVALTPSTLHCRDDEPETSPPRLSCSTSARQPLTSSRARSAGVSRSTLLASTSSGNPPTIGSSSNRWSACRASTKRDSFAQSTTKMSAPQPRACRFQSSRNR